MVARTLRSLAQNALTLSFTVLCTAALSGCGAVGGGNDDGGGGGAPVDQDAWAQAWSEALCEGWVTCGCDVSYDDAASCAEAMSSGFQSALDAGIAAGLTYDASCAGNEIGSVDSLGCSSDWPSAGSCSVCAVLHGDVPLDGACTVVDSNNSWSDCAQGLSCSGGTCINFCDSTGGDLLNEGDACDPQDSSALCDYSQDLYCDYTTMVCTAFPGEGEECPGYLCAAGLVCDSATTTCQPAPGEGEECPDYACAEGLICDDVSGTCVAEPPLVCWIG